MASINSVTGGLSSTSSLRGYGGLASGLDRDELIEQLTYGTRTKIEQQKQKQDKIKWQQTAMRNIIDKAYNFTNKYTSYTSPTTNLTSSLLFSRTDITAVGENSKYVSVSGRADSSDTFSIMGIQQMAKDAKITGSKVSTGGMTTGTIDFTKDFEQNMISGEYIAIKYGADTYYLDLGSAQLDQSDPEERDAALQEMLQNAIKEVKLNDGKTNMSDLLEAKVQDGKVSFTRKGDGSNQMEITGGSGEVLQRLGFLAEGQDIEDLEDGALVLEKDQTLTGAHEVDPIKKTPLDEFLPGKELTFDYNGTSKTITLGDNITDMASLKADLQNKLDSAFGKGRITVDSTGDNMTGQLTFNTTTPDGKADSSSTITLLNGESGMMGKEGVFRIVEGSSNRVNLNGTLAESGLLQGDDLENPVLQINGKEIKIEILDEDGNAKALKDATMEEILEAINNNEEAGVKISYQKSADRFVITSTQKGASGEIQLDGNLAEAMFGKDAIGAANAVKGQDAIVAVKYAGDDTETLISRDSNAFTMDGLTVTLKGTFGYQEVEDEFGVKKLELDPTTEEITFDARVDTENTTKVVKDMIAAYNEIVDLINTELGTKPDRDYSPLTATQKKDMSETEIKEWEENAKKGLLFGDSDLRSFASALRFVLPSGDVEALREIGISTSTNYEDNGKLVLDEAKFKAALETNPERVSELFTRTASTDKDGNLVEGGFMSKITEVMKNYAGTTGATKGILVERAGSEHSPLSVLQNTMQKQIDEIDKYMNRLLDRLEAEEDRYISQFTALESLINQMNSQSSYLSQLTGQQY